ncbi:type II toxin-antitoxin system YhaV family toxin [Klebsiella aerogenes]|uniref:type II toxin-antitoxin system YhaV family toxin n=1 Tax=Klebsiella aerogenes TaxID=548 RepID=UPI003983FCC9
MAATCPSATPASGLCRMCWQIGAGRYRLFIRYNMAQKVIVLGWMNNESTLRAYNSKTDTYPCFAAIIPFVPCHEQSS